MIVFSEATGNMGTRPFRLVADGFSDSPLLTSNIIFVAVYTYSVWS